MTGASQSERDVVLAVFAHPDDETLLAGALIPLLVDEGKEVHLLCVAPGDDDDLKARMEQAAADLGIASVSSLRFAAAGTADGRGSPQLLSAPRSAVMSQVEGVMKSLSPGMIVTHSASGDYGHPDHARVHEITVAAADGVAPDARVFALAWPRWALRLNRMAQRATRSDSVRQADLPVTETRNVSRYLGVRKRASRHYRKEIARGPLPLRLLESAPTWLQRPVLGKARLSRVR